MGRLEDPGTAVTQGLGRVRFDDLRSTEVTEGIVRRVVPGARATLVEVRIAAGAALPAHAHPHEQFTFVLSGEIQFRVGTDLKECSAVRAGELFHVAGDVLHQSAALEDAVLVEIFAPARDDLAADARLLHPEAD